MEGIGHFDFGKTLRPVDFEGWYDRSKYHNPKEIGFWLEYWCATYRSLIGEAAQRVALLNYDAFCAEPGRGLERITQFIEVGNKSAFLAQVQRIHAPSSHELEDDRLDETLVEEAKALYSRLAAFSIV